MEPVSFILMVIVYLVWRELSKEQDKTGQEKPRPKSSTGKPPVFRQEQEDDS